MSTFAIHFGGLMKNMSNVVCPVCCNVPFFLPFFYFLNNYRKHINFVSVIVATCVCKKNEKIPKIKTNVVKIKPS